MRIKELTPCYLLCGLETSISAFLVGSYLDRYAVPEVPES